MVLGKCSFQLPRDKRIHKSYAKIWLECLKTYEAGLKEQPLDVEMYPYFIGINEFGNLYSYEVFSAIETIDGKMFNVSSSGKKAMLDLDQDGILSFKTKEERDKALQYIVTTHEVD